MSAKFVLKKTADGQCMFNLCSSNGQVILTSERYAQKAGALNGIDSVRKNAVIEARYDRGTSDSGKPYFRLKAANGQVIGVSQMYAGTDTCEAGIDSVKRSAATATVDDQTNA